MEQTMKKSDIALTAAFTAAVTTFVVGLPMEFATELVTFPFAHESALGSHLVNQTSQVLVPIFDTVGQWFGIEPIGAQLADVPVADF